MNDLQQLRFQVTSGMLPSARQWQRLIQTRLGRFGISSACMVPFLFIGRGNGGLHQVALAEQVGIEGPSLVRLLDKLAAAGLVVRESDASDRRAKQLWLTAAGQALHGELEQALTALRDDILGGLSGEELQAVLKLQHLIEEATAALP